MAGVIVRARVVAAGACRRAGYGLHHRGCSRRLRPRVLRHAEQSEVQGQRYRAEVVLRIDRSRVPGQAPGRRVAAKRLTIALDLIYALV
jgi:hypothetical protein